MARLGCTDRCPKQQQPVAIPTQPPAISIGWVSIGCKICSYVATHKHRIITNITHDTFLYTIPFYIKVRGYCIAIPFNDYPCVVTPCASHTVATSGAIAMVLLLLLLFRLLPPALFLLLLLPTMFCPGRPVFASRMCSVALAPMLPHLF